MRPPLPLTVLAALALVACSGEVTPPDADPNATPGPSSAVIRCAIPGRGQFTALIEDFQFAPEPLVIAAGSSATWTNNSTRDHTVTFDGGPDCHIVSPARTVTISFAAPGSYTYHCVIHRTMKGTVQVNAL